MGDRMKGKVAFITGGSDGIGRATSIRLAEEGAHVIICARRAENLAEAEAAVKAVGGGPAQLVTRMSGASQAATSSARPRAVDTSATTARTSTPVARSADAASSQSAGVRELMTRLTPSRASDSAQARPRPFVDPATMAHRPAIPRST